MNSAVLCEVKCPTMKGSHMVVIVVAPLAHSGTTQRIVVLCSLHKFSDVSDVGVLAGIVILKGPF